MKKRLRYLVGKDELWKGVIEELPESFLEFFYEDYKHLIDFKKQIEFLDTELHKISRGLKGGKKIADKLIKVHLLSGEEKWFLVHVEVQNYADETISHRMFTMYYRILDKYGVGVTALLIKAYDGKKVLNKYQSSFMGTELQYKYNVYDIMRLKSEIIDYKNIFSFILLAAYYDIIYKNNDQEKYESKFSIVKKLLDSGQKLIGPKPKIREILNFITTYMGLNDTDLDKNIELYITKKEKIKGNMGLQELFAKTIEREVLKTERISTKKGEEIGIKKGEVIGIKKGEVRGIKKGEVIGVNKIICTMYLENVDIPTIARFTKISTAEVKKCLIENGLISK